MAAPHVELPLHVRLRIRAVKMVARWLNIPIKVRTFLIPEYKRKEIERYVAGCEELFGPIFDADKRDEFHEWVYPFLLQDIDNPFNLYHHPLETVALFFGISFDGTEEGARQMHKLYDKYRDTGLQWIYDDPAMLELMNDEASKD